MALAATARVVYSEVVTAVEAYELTTQGGATDFARLIAVCEAMGPYCVIGGLAVNCFVEPVYTLDAGLVVVAAAYTPVIRISPPALAQEAYSAFPSASPPSKT